MLPQFGYIVAQAGADSRPPPSQSVYGHSRSSPPPSAQPSQQGQPILGGGVIKETKTYYNGTTPRSPIQDSSIQKMAGAPSRSTMLPPSATTPSSSHIQPPLTAVGNPYMYSTTSVPPLASSQGMEYNAHYYGNYDRGTNIESHPQAGTSFRPLQQAPPRPPTTYQWQPHDPYMDHSYRVPPASAWHMPPPPTSSVWQMPPLSPSNQPPTSHDHPSSLPPPTTTSYAPNTTNDSPMYESSVKQTPRWHQDDTSGLNEPKMFRRLREYNELMAWMDNEFWEQNDEVYQEKLQSLQKELKSIQEGDHAAFQELVTDLEIIRDQTIESALCFENYQMTMTKQDLDLDVMLIEEEFKNDSQHLNEVIMLVIDEHRKQIKDDRDDTDELDTYGIFREAYTRVQQKRNLRKRTAQHINANGDRPSPSRQETSSRGRRLKNTTVPPHNINAGLTAKEEDDVESEYMTMKGVIPKRNAGTSRR